MKIMNIKKFFWGLVEIIIPTPYTYHNQNDYFDGALYYKITSRSEKTATITKADCKIKQIRVPEFITLRGKKYIITSIYKKAFHQCTELSSVIIADNIKTIGESVFYGCSGLTSVFIPNSVKCIGERAFEGCSSLASITIPSSVRTIGKDVFLNCENLTKVNFESIEGLCMIDFADYSSNPLSYVHHLYIKGQEVKELTIPQSVTSIKKFTFSRCEGLTSVNFSSKVSTIGNGAFEGCNGLTSLTLPNTVTSIGEYAFWGCDNLTSITIPNSVTSIGKYAFWGCI